MGRRIASQVHHQVSRLMRGGLIKQEPIWYQPVLNFPPLPLPPRAPPARSAYDKRPLAPGGKPRRQKVQPQPIYYLEDDIRRQFFSDHPFEAFRPTTLVEKGDVELREPDGMEWTRLRQRGRNPTVEDAIQFTLNLHHTQRLPLSDAYAFAVAQFRALRSEHHITTTIAAMEADELGGSFIRGEIEHAFEKEKRAIATWEELEDMDQSELIARKKWKMVAEPHAGETQWSRGAEYVRLWRTNNRVDYSPAMTGPVQSSAVDEDEDEEDIADADEEDIEVPEEEDPQEELNLLTSQELEARVQRMLDLSEARRSN
ncbi:SNF2 superfamily protein [Mycena chlorophos]|uniref:Small ribosomal subunit protein mS23 n=1 Tax=Mycena chlorophos TaxID=658473 RepID=A0A8H6W5Q0_MYCCL|nr:SNF2 superfamily protein [Mycena chlorophos]